MLWYVLEYQICIIYDTQRIFECISSVSTVTFLIETIPPIMVDMIWTRFDSKNVFFSGNFHPYNSCETNKAN